MRAASPLTFVSRLFVALLFLGFVVEQAPHTVHHVFDPEYTGEECPFATAGDRSPGLGAEAIGVDHGPAWHPVAPAPAPARLPDVLVQGPLARAPPRLVSSLA
ncbi:MAG TPA: hypothetical protein VIE37_00345 [Methylomirabilota bacterium]